MPYFLHLTHDYIDPLDPFAAIVTAEDKRLLKRFQEGDQLVVLRGEFSDSWHIEAANGANREDLYGDSVDACSAKHSSAIPWALLHLAESAGATPGPLVRRSNWGKPDEMKPSREWFLYSEKKVVQHKGRWKRFLAMRAQWDDNIEPFAYDPEALSPKALALLRLFKSLRNYYPGVAPRPELHDALEELRLQGLIGLRENGSLVLTAKAHDTKVPRGPGIRSLHAPTPAQSRVLTEQDLAQAKFWTQNPWLRQSVPLLASML
jgi:hypothetical protein